MGGGGAGAGLGGRGAADSARSATMATHGDTAANHGAHTSAMHAADAMRGKHAAAEHEHATSKLAGTDHHHHHHPNRREPQFGGPIPQFNDCSHVLDQYNPFSDCYGPTKSRKGHT